MHQDQVIQRMDQQLSRWDVAGDPRRYFLACYRLMSANMLEAISNGEFEDAEWVHRLLTRFSEYYFEALDLYESGSRPPVWQDVHDRTCGRELHRVQCLLLGVNAHINYDLSLTLVDLLEREWPSLSEERRGSRYRDHSQVNRIIYRSIDAVQDEILEPGDPVMSAVDVLFGRLDEYLLSRMISNWREEVWGHALQILGISSQPDRQAYILKMQEQADRRTERFGVTLF